MPVWFLSPYLFHPGDSHGQQISTFNSNGPIFPGLAGVLVAMDLGDRRSATSIIEERTTKANERAT